MERELPHIKGPSSGFHSLLLFPQARATSGATTDLVTVSQFILLQISYLSNGTDGKVLLVSFQECMLALVIIYQVPVVGQVFW